MMEYRSIKLPPAVARDRLPCVRAFKSSKAQIMGKLHLIADLGIQRKLIIFSSRACVRACVRARMQQQQQTNSEYF